jgi:hypothetical protein
MKQKPSARVSDHAVIRYLERARCIDIDAIRSEILTPDRIRAIENGATRIKVGRFEFLVIDRTIVTIID